MGRILLESIAYHIRHSPGNVLNGTLEVRPYAEGDCNGSTAPETTTKRGRLIKPVVHFWPKAYAKFFRSSVSTYRLVEKFCRENPALTKNLAEVKASFNPIAAFYKESMQAWIYANSEASETRDAPGPDSWDTYQELRKYSTTSRGSNGADGVKTFKKWFGKKASN